MEQNSDQNIQFLMKNYSISHPKLQCKSNNQITNVCVNPACKSHSLYCNQPICNQCFQKHLICQNVSLNGLTHLLQKRQQSQKQFIIKILQIENQMIQRIKNKRKEITKNYYMGDIEKQFSQFIESVYIKKQNNYQIYGEQVQKIFDLLKINQKQKNQIGTELLQDFQNQAYRLAHNLNGKVDHLINQYINSSRPNPLGRSAIQGMNNKDVIKFLNQCFVGVKKFELLFRASQHAFSAAKFHGKCDNIRNTLTIVKTQFGKIIGGYNSLAWGQSKTGYIPDKQGLSFLLSFNSQHKINIHSHGYAIYNKPNYGPTFGGGHDLFINDKCNQNSDSYANIGHSYKLDNYYSCNQQSYTLFSGATANNNFGVVEYEVYRVLW